MKIFTANNILAALVIFSLNTALFCVNYDYDIQAQAQQVYESTTSNFRIANLPAGWVVEDSAASGTLNQGERMMEAIFNFEDIGTFCKANQAIPAIGGGYDCQNAVSGQNPTAQNPAEIKIFRWSNLQARPEFANVQSTPVPNDVMGLFIKFSKEVGDMTIGAGSQITYEVTSQQDVAVKVSNGQTVPAKLATLTMTLTDSVGEIYQQHKIFALFLVGPDGNTGYSIISPRWRPATTPQAPTEIMQILQSFELVA
jgi:hypothetical protein